MNIVISVFTSKAFKEFFLPNLNNTNYSIPIEKSVFDNSEDVYLLFDVIEHKWRIMSDESYVLRKDGEEIQKADLEEGMMLEVLLSDGNCLKLNVSFADSGFLKTHKYSLNTNSISIGSDKNNDIVFNGRYISHLHAKIAYKHDGWMIEDYSQNGIFLNCIRVKVSQPIKYGDTINIIGLKIVFLGNMIAVSCDDRQKIAFSDRLKPVDLNLLGDDSEEEANTKKKSFFNRAPRIMRELFTEPIEIEAPPTPKNEEERSLLSTIGPSFTMAIPMMLSCLLMVYSSKRMGGATSPFMFMGLITASSSAILGVFWGITNYRKAKKKSVKDEKKRFEAYSDYLMKTAEKIKDMRDHNREVLHEMYPSAEACAKYTRKNTDLWNRNYSHEDFLSHRVGIGEAPFQAEITIPKEKFSLIDDSLANKPQLIKESFETMKDVPVCLDMMNNSLIGIVGGKNKTGAFHLLKILSAQIAVSNCYTDVKLVYLFGENAPKDLVGFSKWLPHCWSADKKTRYCAFDAEEASDICYELTKIFRMRDEAQKDTFSQNKGPARPHYVIFVEDLSILEGEPLAKYIFEKREEYGLTTILLTENYENLPNTCECIVYNDGTYTGIYEPSTLSTLSNKIFYDSIENNELEELARNLAKIEVSEVTTGGEIPNTLTFLEMYKVDKIEELNVIERWKKNRTYENMRSLIGQKAGGTDCYLDVHEKYHGPHGLVAGTTGSGKSETLQTYILSLAINYSPDDVGFLLVDFKGGGMANLFTNLPHTLGQISNLSGSQVRRCMVSIKSENLRRQRVLSEHGVNNINAYTRLLKNNEATVPMPHLFIIIDEFAEMKREEPEFMSELISVAQVGRSLGVHLILATQKPGGVVDDNIRSNSKFKLCLRVQDKQDSSEMLGKPDAAYLSQAGRCYLQVGNDEIYELFQSGWSGATYDNEGGSVQSQVRLISNTGKVTLNGNKSVQKFKEQIKKNWLTSFASCIEMAALECNMDLSEQNISAARSAVLQDKVFALLEQMEIEFPDSSYNRKCVSSFTELLIRYGKDNISEIMQTAQQRNIALPEPKEKTQLDAVIAHLCYVADKYDYHRGNPLWMPMLPEVLPVANIREAWVGTFDAEGHWTRENNWSLVAPIGMLDDPENQAQMPLYVDFAESGHIAVCGNVTSGKSTFLQSMLFSFANRYSPQQLNMYILDFSNHLLQAFENYPHTGAVMFENDMEKIDKFFYMVTQMLAERKKKVGGGNFGQFINAQGDVLPAVIIAIDSYSNFREKTDDKYEQILWEISRDGAGFGIFLAISAGGFGSVEIQNKIGENIRNVIALDLGDKMKFSEVLRIMHLDVLPTSGVKGRGLAVYGDSVLEFQTVVALEAEDDYERTEKIAEIGKQMKETSEGYVARKVPEIPEKPNWNDLKENDVFLLDIKSPDLLPFAYVKETAAIYSVDLRETFCYLIQGKSRTGRSDLMRLLMAAASKKKGKVCIMEPNGIQFQRTGEKLGADYFNTAKQIFDFCNSEFITVFKDRNAIKRKMIEDGAEESDIFDKMATQEPFFIFVPDLLEFLSVIYTYDEEVGQMNGFFENILEKGRLHNIYFFFDSNLDDVPSLLGKKVYNIISGYKVGVQLGGLPGQKVFDLSTIPFAEQNKAYRPGTGFAFNSLGGEKIIIPSSKGI